MKSTASISFAHKGMDYSKLTAHNKRSYKKDKNENINPKFSPSNIYGRLINWKELYIPRIKNYVKRKNTRARSQGNYGRQTTVQALLHKKYQNITRCGIITIGDSKFRNKFEKALKPHTERDLLLTRSNENKVLLFYAEGFNKRHHHIKIGRIACHGDERFIHAHAEFIALPDHTKGTDKRHPPRPSFSFSKALKQEYNTKSNKIAMKQFRAQEDHEIIRQFNKLADFSKTPRTKLKRTGNATKATEEQHSEEISVESQAEQAKASLAQINQQASNASINASQWNSRAHSQSLAQASSQARFEKSKARTVLSLSSANSSITRAKASVFNSSLDNSLASDSIAKESYTISKKASNLSSTSSSFNNLYSEMRAPLVSFANYFGTDLDTPNNISITKNGVMDSQRLSDQNLLKTTKHCLTRFTTRINRYLKRIKRNLKSLLGIKNDTFANYLANDIDGTYHPEQKIDQQLKSNAQTYNGQAQNKQFMDNVRNIAKNKKGPKGPQR